MAANAFFLPDESEWLLKCVPRYLQTKDRGPDQAICGHKILDKFYVEFPYWHPRYFNLFRIEEEEEGQVIYGDNWKHMQERFCNWVHSKRCLKRKDATENPDSFELYPTQEQLQEELAGEGFYDIDVGNPYSVDGTILKEQLELTISCLDGYGASDYACMVDDQRDFATRSLQQDLHNIVQLLNAKTGGVFYIFGAWHNKEDGYVWGSTKSENLRSLPIQELEEVECFEGMAVRHVETYLGRSLCTLFNEAPPTVYGDLNGSYRPVMPPPRATWQMDDLYQGGKLPIPWDIIKKDCLRKKWRIIAVTRMPNGMDCLHDLDVMDEDKSTAWYQHARMDFTNPDAQPNVFQCCSVGPGEYDEALRVEPHPQSDLSYGPEARLYIARLLQNKEEMVPASAPELPPLPSDSFQAFMDAELVSTEEMLVADEVMFNMVGTYQEYEDLGPPQMSATSWTQFHRNSPHVPSRTPVDVNRLELLGGRWLPDEYFNVRELATARAWSFATLFNWLQTNLFMDKATNMLLSGPYGVI
ncbi:hypothetical protein BDV93DRAFT_562846 [Ceratobasidium sp. AG-I]|nr:hypothetical protein BDV93DRAFT_562846 [Ceratobasidium sp. AG-I]